MPRVQYQVGGLKITIEGGKVLDSGEEVTPPPEPTDPVTPPEPPVPDRKRTDEEKRLFKLRADGYFDRPKTMKQIDFDNDFDDAELQIALAHLVDEGYLTAATNRFGIVMYLKPSQMAMFASMFV